MTRVIHLASGREWRGGQRQTWLLVRELQKLGVEQLLITAAGSELARRARSDGVPVREVSWTMGIDPRAWWAVRNEAARGPAILHAHDGHAVTIARWAASSSVPWIATRRNASPLATPAGWRSAARVVAISRAVREQLVRDGIEVGRIVVVPSGIDLEATRAAPHEDLRAWAHLENGGAVIATIGTLESEKGFDVIPAALDLLLRKHSVWWVAIGDGPMRKQLKDDWSREGHLAVPGHHPDPVRLLRGADLFVSASRSEGLGTSVLDALALDIPVVATRSGGTVELLEGDPAQLVPVDDAPALAAAIGRMLDEPALRQRCVAAGRTTVARYTAQAMAAGMRTVYDSIDANR